MMATVLTAPPPSVGKRVSIGEDLTCAAMEVILGRSVVRGIRPDHLRNPATGRNLEYDCWDPVGRIAVEYDGAQHYRYTPRYHNSEAAFHNQLERDRLKTRLSEQAGVRLIRVAYTVDAAAKSDRDARYRAIHSYLQTQLA